MIRVLIVDDHAMVREGLRLFLTEAAGEIEVVGEAASGPEALQFARRLQPDVLLLDLILPEMDGVAVARTLRDERNPARILILTSFADDTRVRDAIQAGVTGYLLKDVVRSDLLRAIRAAAEGKPTLHPEAQQHLMRQVGAGSASGSSPLATLTERERDVLILVATGCSNKEIAARLFLSVGTIKGYVSAILAKLDVADRTQATLHAIQHGLVQVDPPPSSRP
ncbi:MAG: response regulator transcription factor [Cytophagales bacterium]|nr:response regulator transcription factor [Armatimonadota bacterium]